MNVVQLENVNLFYSSLAYRETSLKTQLFKMLSRKNRHSPLTDIHALKNITLTIQPGERVGLIGHNGAGKSTLLKAIAQLYPISSGQRKVHGKIRSLFELNLGFETEATGRENILYRGLLLGQTHKEIYALMQEIIDFADLKQFIDYPIKTYSAGMLVRLAFAISTSVPGDLLLLDEIIGAGDANFMKKSQVRLQELVSQAKVMILASHDLSMIRNLCNRIIVLNRGSLVYDGQVEAGIRYYLELIHSG